MKYCPNCGSKLGAEYKFCQECGHSLTRGQTSESDTSPKEVQGKDAKDEPDSDECLHENAVNLGANEAYCNECSKYIDLETGQIAESAKPGSWSNCQHLSLEKDLRGPNGERICANCGDPVSQEKLNELAELSKVAGARSHVGLIILAIVVIGGFLIAVIPGHSGSSSSSDSGTTSIQTADSSLSIPTDAVINAFTRVGSYYDPGDPTNGGFPDIQSDVKYYTARFDAGLLIIYPTSADLDADSANFQKDFENYQLPAIWQNQAKSWTSCGNVIAIYPESVSTSINSAFSSWCN